MTSEARRKRKKSTAVADEAVADEAVADETVRVFCSDRSCFDVPVKMGTESLTFKNIVESCRPDSEISLSCVRGEIFKKILEYWKMHVGEDRDEDPIRKNDLKRWDERFVVMATDSLLEVLQAANYLKMEKLEDLLARTVAHQISKLTVEEVRKYFGIAGDLTREEEAKVREENKWAYE